MKIIVLHDKYSNEPIVIKPNAITMIQKFKDDEIGEYSSITVGAIGISVKETIGTVLNKIKKAESEEV